MASREALLERVLRLLCVGFDLEEVTGEARRDGGETVPRLGGRGGDQLLRAEVRQEPSDCRDGVVEHSLVALTCAVREMTAEPREEPIVERCDPDPVPVREDADVDSRTDVPPYRVSRVSRLGKRAREVVDVRPDAA